jgi:nucleotidyltransferase/DNA polymerase involved in DNA repair
MPFACIFVPDFPAEAILRAEPELRSQAMAVLEGNPPLQKIFAVNEKARRAGIELGMTKIQAEPWNDLALRPRSPLQETAAHAALLDCAQSFSPRIEDTAPDTVILDLSGLESLFGALPKIARDLARRTSDLGLEANVAVAANPDTARFAARGFPGVTVIPEGKEAERLGNLPLDVLVPELASPDPSNEAARVFETFDLWGVRNLRALCALPEIALSERLGQFGVRLQHLARGAVSRTLVPIDPPLVFEEAVELEYPLVLLEPLAFLLARMLDHLCARLAARALAAQTLHLQLHLDSGFHFVEDVPADESTTTHIETAALESLSRKQSRGPDQAHVGTAAPGCPGRVLARQPADSDAPQLTNCHPERSESFVKNCHPEQSEAPAERSEGPAFQVFHPERGESVVKNCHPERSEGPAFPPRVALPPIQNPNPKTRHSTFTRTLDLPVPMLDAKVFLKLLQLDLKAHSPGAPILKVHLSATPAQPRTTQGGLFLPPTPEPEKLELTLARIAGMVGEDKVGSLQLVDSHHPTSFRMQRFVPSPPRGSKEKSDDSLSSAPIAALRLFRPPLRATVTLHDGRPSHVVCPKRKEIHGEILWLAGPWRSSGDWWDQDGWARDEWDIAIQWPVPSGQWPERVASRQSVAGRQSPVASEEAISDQPSTISQARLAASRFVSGRGFSGAKVPASKADSAATNEKTTLALYRLVHDLLSGHWFVEGTYD